MSWIADLSPSRKRAAILGSAAVLGVAVVLGGGFAVISGTSHAAEAPTENCQGLDQALQNNLNFIAQQKAHPDSQSAARIANRQAVVDQIEQRLQAAGCSISATTQPTDTTTADSTDTTTAGSTSTDTTTADSTDTSAPTDTSTADPTDSSTGATVSDQVCKGSTVTLSGEGGSPAAASDQFPVGTMLKVTNLDNNKSITVPVTSVSGSCALLNNDAFNQIHQAGKFLIRHALIEKVSN